MKTKILTLTLLFLIQGCTVLGMIADSQFPPDNPNDKDDSFTQMGIEADIELARSVINDEPLPGNEPKKLTGCKELTGKKQIECYQVSRQLNENLQKHQRK